MKDKIIPVSIVFGLSMLCAFVVILPGNRLDSPLNRLAAPSVCGERVLEVEKNSEVYIQGEQTHQVTAYCVEVDTGEKQDVSNELIKAIGKLQVVAAVIVGLILFGMGMLFLRRAARKLNIPFEDLFKPSVRRENRR